MKIKNKILLLFTSIIVVVIVLGIATTNYVTNHYIHYKYDSAYDHYYSQGLSTSEFSEYLINQGFIVTEQEIPEYKGAGDITCHIEDDQIIVYEQDEPVLYAVLNENIVTDLNLLLIYAAVFINVLVFIMLVVIYVYFNKSILYKLNKLQSEMINFKNVDQFTIADHEPINEIDSLSQEFYQMANQIKLEDKQKKFLIMTLSHELKNPISNIEAIIDMNQLGVEPYNDNLKQNELITTQVMKMKSIVSDLLNAYKFEAGQSPTKIDVEAKIRKIVSEQQLPTSNLQFNYHILENTSLEVNEKVFELIINNIISNIYKYSLDTSSVTITLTGEGIKFENIRTDTPSDKSTEIGLLLNQYMSTEIGLEIDIRSDTERYITLIKF